jgi:hypothetical protein
VDRSALRAQIVAHENAFNQYFQLLKELERYNLPTIEHQFVERLKAQVEKTTERAWSVPNTAGIDFKPDEVITENVEVYMRVLGKTELITEAVNQVNAELEKLVVKARAKSTPKS